MHKNPNAVYIFAPQGSGKTRNADLLAQLLGCDTVMDNWDGVSPAPDRCLVLTNSLAILEGRRAE